MSNGHHNMKACLLAAVVLTVLMSGCAPHLHDYTAEKQSIANDSTLSPAEKGRRFDEISQKESQEYLAIQNQAQWFPSEVIAGVFGFVLISALAVRRLQSAPAASGPSPSKSASAKTAASQKTPAKTGNVRAAEQRPADPKAPAAPARAAAPWEVPAEPVKVLEAGQEDVDAIPYEERGVSFFTSRPLSLVHLVPITITISGKVVTVRGTQEEADAVSAGRIPRVRALTISGETRPWYAWDVYAPYRDYWPAAARDWVWPRGQVVASWVAIDRLDPRLIGYLTSLAEASAAAAAAAPGEPPARLLKANVTLMARRLPAFKPRTLLSRMRPAVLDRAAPLGVDLPARQWRIKANGPKPWIFHVRSRPKKANLLVPK